MAKSAKKQPADILRCPHCGGSDIAFDEKEQKLRCKSCRALFNDESVNKLGGVDELEGNIIDAGASNIIPDEKTILTLKCPSCGAEVVINTDEVTHARCHWCRHILSVTDKLPNGAVPDLVLPFKVKKEEAIKSISKYLDDRKFFANKTFRKEYNAENVMGFYMPYMVVDMNVHASMSGIGRHLVRRYTVGSGDDEETRYDVDDYTATREFDLMVDDLTIEASYDKLNQDTLVNTNNVINSIMPFDTENAVAWDARYLRGFASEKRDVNPKAIDKRVKLQVEDIMRFQMRDSLKFYDCGTRWDRMQLNQKGTKWKAAYLPVWLYSYLEVDKNGNKKMHYIAVNARTGETAGSVPINKVRKYMVIFGGPIICLTIASIMSFFDEFVPNYHSLMIYELLEIINSVALYAIIPLLIFGLVVTGKYTNKNARHLHESETKAEISNMKQTDHFSTHHHGMSTAIIHGRNDNILRGVQVHAGTKTAGNIFRPGGSAQANFHIVNPNKTTAVSNAPKPNVNAGKIGRTIAIVIICMTGIGIFMSFMTILLFAFM